MRCPETCRYRLANSADAPSASGAARCRLVARILGAEDPALARVRLADCRACCKRPEPNRRRIHGVIASILFDASREILARGGVPGCSVHRATRLKRWATVRLDRLDVDPGSLAVPRAGPCFYLGRGVGENQGSVGTAAGGRKYRCHHERHTTTTLSGCRGCPDYDQRLRQGVKTWSVAVISAPRANPTLGRSLASLAQAGWTRVQVFAEPGTPIPSTGSEVTFTTRAGVLGSWSNFLLALLEMYLRDPRADAYMICEDDVVYGRGLRGYLEQSLWPANRVGVVSLFTPSHQDRTDRRGFFPSHHGNATWGALCFVFPNASLRACLRDPRVINHRQRGIREGWCDADVVVGQWCLESGLTFYQHTPSPTQHIGETSAVWPSASLDGKRISTSFPGEQMDIGEVMSRPAPRDEGPQKPARQERRS